MDIIHIAFTLLHHILIQYNMHVNKQVHKNACLLNVSTDGVSCDVNNNKKINLDYLDGMSKTLALVDNKDDNKKAHGQHRLLW